MSDPQKKGYMEFDFTGGGVESGSSVSNSAVEPNSDLSEKSKQPLAIVRGETDLGVEAHGQREPIHHAPKKVDIKYLVKALVKYSASDLHIKPSRPPLYRVNGKLIPAKMPQLSAEEIQNMLFSILSERQLQIFQKRLQLDFSFRVGDLGRFRCNIFYQRGMVSAVVRMIPLSVRGLDQLGMPDVLKELCHKHRGLILVTGATGSGKSTTLSGMINFINEQRPIHILTIEDPIEFMYKDVRATITQREVGQDTHTFQDALIAGLRQDPDVIMVGEMREPETIHTVLTAAETGHLVMSTLHTRDAKGTIDRILDVFPSDEQSQIRIQLAAALVAVVSQKLVPRADGMGRVPACEVMIKSPAIEQYILKNEVERIPEAISSSNNYYKMQSLNQDLLRLTRAGIITEEDAVKHSNNPEDLKLQFEGVARE